MTTNSELRKELDEKMKSGHVWKDYPSEDGIGSMSQIEMPVSDRKWPDVIATLSVGNNIDGRDMAAYKELREALEYILPKYESMVKEWHEKNPEGAIIGSEYAIELGKAALAKAAPGVVEKKRL